VATLNLGLDKDHPQNDFSWSTLVPKKASGLCWWCYYVGKSIHTIKKNKEASKETGLEVNNEKTNFMVMSRDQNAGQNTAYRKIINTLKAWNTIKIFGEQP
jgi:hypothetical protein